MKSIKGAHDEENMANLINEVLVDYQIDREKIHLIARDGASSMQAATRIAQIDSIWCFAHILNLAVKDGLNKLPDFKSTIENVKTFVRKVRKSRILMENFGQNQELFELPDHVLVKSIDVHWNSMHDILDRFIENRAAINLLAANHISLPYFSQEEWAMMISLFKILQPIKKATVACQSRTVSIGHVIPFTKLIELDLEKKQIVKDFPAVQKAIIDGLRNRLNSSDLNVEDDKNFVLATLLVPAWKQHPFDEKNHAKCKDMLVAAIEGTINIETTSAIDEDIEEEGHSSDPFERLFKQPNDLPNFVCPVSPPLVDERVRAIAEVEDYLSRPRDKSYANASGFWNDPINSSKYPRLKSLVYKYHSAPATSAESERLFSTAKLILTDLRKNLSAENFEKQLFLHHNLLILDGKMEENRIKKI